MDVTFSRFVQALRNADVRVSPAETLDAFDVVSQVGIEDKRLLRDALGLVLAKTREEKERFEDAFDRFFLQLAFREPAKPTFVRGVDREALVEELGQHLSGGLVRTIDSVLSDERDYLAFLVQQAAEDAGISAMRTLREKRVYAGKIAQALALDELEAYLASGEARGEAGGGTGNGADPLLRYLRQYFHGEIRDYVDAQYKLHVDATGRRALLEAALKSQLDRIPREYHVEVRRVVEKLARKLAREHRRRQRRSARGMLDLKKTLRRNLSYDGAIFEPHWRRVKREKATVFVLCDVSGSVAQVSRFLLLFLYELTDVLPNVRAFAFSSALGEVTETFSRKAPEEAVEQALFDWGKGTTDYARAFRDFRERCGKDLDGRSTVVVLGDGRNNYFDPQAHLLKEISQRVKQVFWLNPETRDRWSDGDSEMRRYAPYCLGVRTCNRIEHIETFAQQLLTAAR